MSAPNRSLSRRVLARPLVAFACVLIGPLPVYGQDLDLMDDDIRVMIAVDELEWSGFGSDGTLAWDADLWAGTDLNKFWLKTEGERVDGHTENHEIDLLYSRAIRPFWDFQAGIRRDLESSPERNWAVIGVQGLAPYWFEVETSLAFADGGQQRLHARASYELPITQRLFLEPEAEVSVYSEGEPARLIESGLSRFEFGLRLRYELRREVAPYVGLVRHEYIGDTADLLEARGLDASDTEIVIGIRLWY